MSVRGEHVVPAEYGQLVEYTRTVSKPTKDLYFPMEVGQGVFELCWLGIEEVWNVRRDDGTVVGLHPCFGDAMVPVE